MRKLRKFLRILLIILPFSVSTAFAVEQHAGGNSYGGGYNEYHDTAEASWDNITYIHDRDPSWVTQMRIDIANSLLSPSFTAEARQFLLMWNYTHYYGSLENQPEQIINADSYMPVNYYQVTWAMRGEGVPFYWNIVNEIGISADTRITGETFATYAEGTYDFYNGAFTVHIDNFPLASAEELKVTISGINGIAGRFTDISTNAYSVTIIEGNGSYENGRLYYDDNDVVSLVALFHPNTDGDYRFNFLSESITPEIVAPETPELTYPTQTYYDNSTGDTVTNNYYEKEINYYNYMTNAVDVLEDKADANYFEEQTQNGFSWGLLSLPAGLTAGMLEALGEYSSVCRFSTQPMSISILNGHYLHIPAMSFSFNADDYPWLLPFRYIIALSILFVLCKQGWILLANVINGGTGDE